MDDYMHKGRLSRPLLRINEFVRCLFEVVLYTHLFFRSAQTCKTLIRTALIQGIAVRLFSILKNANKKNFYTDGTYSKPRLAAASRFSSAERNEKYARWQAVLFFCLPTSSIMSNGVSTSQYCVKHHCPSVIYDCVNSRRVQFAFLVLLAPKPLEKKEKAHKVRPPSWKYSERISLHPLCK